MREDLSGRIWVTKAEAARHLGYSVRTLERLHRQGKGPPRDVNCSPMLYPLDLLDEWRDGILSKPTTTTTTPETTTWDGPQPTSTDSAARPAAAKTARKRRRKSSTSASSRAAKSTDAAREQEILSLHASLRSESEQTSPVPDLHLVHG